MLTWPPSYTVKVSKKAKYLQLKITHSYDLQVIVPNKHSKKITTELISEFIETKKHWISKHLTAQPEKVMPQQIIILQREIVNVSYEAAPRNASKLVKQELIIKSLEHGKITVLKRWLKNYAKKILMPLAENLAQMSNLLPAKINIKEQKHLWGNCSSAKVINLNYKLIFLPLPLVQHVILHELAHLQHLNHSTKFWQLLQALDHNALEHDRQLKTANNYVPIWIY